jgi:hypothetical protein
MTDNNDNNLEAVLAGRNAEDYGPDYAAHTLDIYKGYVQTVEHVSERRQKANSFFLTLNTAIVALASYLQPAAVGSPLEWARGLVVPLAGISICYVWYRVLRSYAGLNSGKFDVILQLEERLPVRPFEAEWVALAEGKNAARYKPLGTLERGIPGVFLAIHLVVIALVGLTQLSSMGEPATPAAASTPDLCTPQADQPSGKTDPP